jgi:hypothetical protein
MDKPAPALSADHPNLVKARQRHRRIQVAWSILFLLVGGTALYALGGAHPLAGLRWLLPAILMLVDQQPAYLALTAVTWAVSLVGAIPAVNAVLALDPISHILGVAAVESLALAVVRLIFLLMAWNQFMFYRMLSGTQGSSGLDPGLAHIPEVIPNRSDRLAWAARLAAVISLAAGLLAIPLSPGLAARAILNLGIALSNLAVGLGLGAAFSPTQKRGTALAGFALGMGVFLMQLMIARGLAG